MLDLVGNHPLRALRRVLTPVIEQTYPLGQVPAALRHLEQKHTRGKLVVSVQP